MQKILKQIGVKTQVTKSKMKIFGNPNLSIKNRKITVSGIYDHRILMSAAVLSLLTGIKADLKNFEQVWSSCPNFLPTIKHLGGKFEIKKKN